MRSSSDFVIRLTVDSRDTLAHQGPSETRDVAGGGSLDIRLGDHAIDFAGSAGIPPKHFGGRSGLPRPGHLRFDVTHRGQHPAKVRSVERVLPGPGALIFARANKVANGLVETGFKGDLNGSAKQPDQVGLDLGLHRTAECGRLGHGKLLCLDLVPPSEACCLVKGSFPLFHSSVSQISTRLGTPT